MLMHFRHASRKRRRPSGGDFGASLLPFLSVLLGFENALPAKLINESVVRLDLGGGRKAIRDGRRDAQHFVARGHGAGVCAM